MSSSSGDRHGATNADYAAKRKKNNEQCRASRQKRKEYEMEMAKMKPVLEITYVRLKREMDQLMRMNCVKTGHTINMMQ